MDLLKPPNGFSDEIGFYWPIASRASHCPKKRQQELAYLRTRLTSKQQLVDAWKFALIRGLEQRLTVKYFADSMDVPERKEYAQIKQDMLDAEIPEEYISKMLYSYADNLIFNGVSKKQRAELLAIEGTEFYPTTLKC